MTATATETATANADPAATLLELRNVTVHYGYGGRGARSGEGTGRGRAGGRAAVTGLDLTVTAGEVVGLIGPSGAGKSTLLRLACGLVLPSSGSVEVLGIDTSVLGRRSNRPTRARIGTVPQDFALVGRLGVARNVAAGRLGRWGPLTALRSLVRPVALDEIVASLDRVGISDHLWDRADQLSGGQQQRTAIARVLFQDPDLWLLDEPVSALDPARSEAVLAELVAAGREPGRAMVMSLHDAPLALSHCDRIVGLRHGVITFDRPAGEITEAMLGDLYTLDTATVAPPGAEP